MQGPLKMFYFAYIRQNPAKDVPPTPDHVDFLLYGLEAQISRVIQIDYFYGYNECFI